MCGGICRRDGFKIRILKMCRFKSVTNNLIILMSCSLKDNKSLRSFSCRFDSAECIFSLFILNLNNLMTFSILILLVFLLFLFTISLFEF
jgi:hypothetical protein